MKRLNQRGASEILSYILVIFIIVAVVGLIYQGVVPAIERNNSQQKFEESRMYIEEIQGKIQEVLENSNGSVVSFVIDLDGLSFEADSNLDKIEIFHNISGNYYKEGQLIREGEIYTFREFEKLIVGLDINGIDIEQGIYLNNTKTIIYIKKISRNKISFLREIDSSEKLNLQKERPNLNPIETVTTIDISNPIEATSFLFSEPINFTSEVNNPVGSYSCSWASSIDGNLIPSKTPYARWDFNETSGNIIYDLIGNIDGNGYNITRTTDRFGRENKALSFNGTSSYVLLDNNISQELNRFAISGWFLSNGSSTYQRIINTRGSAASDVEGWQILINDTTSNFYLYSGVDSSTSPFTGCNTCGNSLTLGKWYHFVMSFDEDNNLNFYVDGQLDESVNLDPYGNITNSLPTAIGTSVAYNGVYGTFNHFFNGKLDDIIIFNNGISSSDVSKLYNNQYSSNNCDINISTLSVGEHTITLSVTDQEQTITETKNITVENPSLNAEINIDSNVYTLGDNIEIDTNITNNVGNYSCSWASSIDGNLTYQKPYAEYRFEETTGDTIYDNIGNIDGTLFNVTRTTDRFGRENNALSFNGTSSYATLDNNISSNLDEITVSTWINPTGSGYQRIINTRGRGAGGSYAGWQLMINNVSSNWDIYSGIDDAQSNYKSCSNCGSLYAQNNWYNVIMSYKDNQDLNFYINGILDASVPIGTYGSISNSLPVAIGAAIAYNGVVGTYDHFFNGKMDDILIFDEAIDQEDVSKLYNNQYSLDNCDINISTLSVGEHTITLSVTDQEQTINENLNLNIE